MRKLEDILNDPRIQVRENKFSGRMGCRLIYGVVHKYKRDMYVIFGDNEGGLEHASVSFVNSKMVARGEVPTWEEMCLVKSIFWDDKEECYEVHPPKSEYINITEALHIWRPCNGKRLLGGTE